MQTNTVTPELTVEERETLVRFAYLVTRSSYWAYIICGTEDYCFTKEAIDRLKSCSQMFGNIRDPNLFFMRAPEIDMLLKAAYRVDFEIPDDFIPSEETIRKCLDGYWNIIRAEAGAEQ